MIWAGLLGALWRLARSKLGIALIAAGLGWWWGSSAAHDACEAEQYRARIAVLERDAAAAQAAERLAASQAAILREEARTNQERVNELESDLAALPAGDVCRADDAGLSRLLQIR